MLQQIVCAGVGGQGVLTAGKLMLAVADQKGLKATWFPSYGNEMRGGAANCNVIISDERVASPYAEHPDILVALAERAIDAYMPTMNPGSRIIANSSVIPEDKAYSEGISVFTSPATEIAQQINNEKALNIVMLGSVIRHTDLFTKEEFEQYMCRYFEDGGKGKFNEKNIEAFRAGYDYEQVIV